jgi:hypothetical protein
LRACAAGLKIEDDDRNGMVSLTVFRDAAGLIFDEWTVDFVALLATICRDIPAVFLLGA